jgi:hypothetical protein
VFRAPRQTVATPDQDDIEPMPVRVLEHLVEAWTAHLRATHTMVYILLHDLVAALCGKPAQFQTLGLRMLVHSRDRQI